MIDIIKYLSGTASHGLFLGGSSTDCPLYAYCDADWAACPKTRKSVTGFIVMCGVGAIAWKSARQPTVSRSSTESEYIACGEVAKELQYLHQLTAQFGLIPGCIPVGCDINAAMSLIALSPPRVGAVTRITTGYGPFAHPLRLIFCCHVVRDKAWH